MILDQTVIAGLGNIYADECLALAGILPTRIANTLTRAEIEAVHEAANKVIAQGIANRGTTFRDYKDGEGNKGDNQNHLLVYGRGGEPCKTCGDFSHDKGWRQRHYLLCQMPALSEVMKLLG